MRPALMPPAVDSAHPPISIRSASIHFSSAGQRSKLPVLNPVEVIKLAQVNAASRAALDHANPARA